MILTVPPSLLAEIDHGGLLTPQWQAFAKEVRLGANEKLNAVYDSKPWTATPMGVSAATWDLDESAPFAEVWECTGGQSATQGVLSWFFGGRQTAALGDTDLRTRLEAAVGASMGDLTGAANAYSARTGWGADPFTQGAYFQFQAWPADEIRRAAVGRGRRTARRPSRRSRDRSCSPASTCPTPGRVT